MNEPRVTHEKRDVDVTSIFLIAALLVMAGIVTAVATAGLFNVYFRHFVASEKAPPKISEERVDFPQPRLEVTAPQELAKFREHEEHDLNTYGWIDHRNGVVRLPIDRAIELLSERGLPEAGAGVTNLQLMQNVPLQNENRAP